ncbi:MAG: ribonuclease HI family protein [Planctomycetota bacterium]
MKASKTPQAGTVTLRFDGASRGNPGPSAAGVVVSAEDGAVLCRRGVRLAAGTNNVAEYKGLLFGLEECRRLGARRVEVRSDSELVVRQMRGEYRVRDPKLRSLYEKARELARAFDDVTFLAVSREDNAQADGLCNLVFRKGRSLRDNIEEPDAVT